MVPFAVTPPGELQRRDIFQQEHQTNRWLECVQTIQSHSAANQEEHLEPAAATGCTVVRWTGIWSRLSSVSNGRRLGFERHFPSQLDHTGRAKNLQRNITGHHSLKKRSRSRQTLTDLLDVGALDSCINRKPIGAWRLGVVLHYCDTTRSKYLTHSIAAASTQQNIPQTSL